MTQHLPFMSRTKHLRFSLPLFGHVSVLTSTCHTTLILAQTKPACPRILAGMTAKARRKHERAHSSSLTDAIVFDRFRKLYFVPRVAS